MAHDLYVGALSAGGAVTRDYTAVQDTFCYTLSRAPRHLVGRHAAR